MNTPAPSTTAYDQAAAESYSEAVAHSYDASAIIEQELGDRLLAKLTDLPIQPHYILDIGCGTGRQAKQLATIFPSANVIGLDLSFAMVKFARLQHEKKFVCADAYSLPFANQQFDLIISNSCLPHIQQHDVFLNEIQRVLKTNGLLLCSSLGPASLQELSIHNPLWIDMHILGDLLLKVLGDPIVETEYLTFTYEKGQMLVDDLLGSGHLLDCSAVTTHAPLHITIEAIYAVAWNKQAKQHKDDFGISYVNIDSIEYL